MRAIVPLLIGGLALASCNSQRPGKSDAIQQIQKYYDSLPTENIDWKTSDISYKNGSVIDDNEYEVDVSYKETQYKIGPITSAANAIRSTPIKIGDVSTGDEAFVFKKTENGWILQGPKITQ